MLCSCISGPQFHDFRVGLTIPLYMVCTSVYLRSTFAELISGSSVSVYICCKKQTWSKTQIVPQKSKFANTKPGLQHWVLVTEQGKQTETGLTKGRKQRRQIRNCWNTRITRTKFHFTVGTIGLNGQGRWSSDCTTLAVGRQKNCVCIVTSSRV